MVPGVQSGVHHVDDQLANPRQQVNQRFFAIRYNVLFNLLKVTRLYIFCIFFNLAIIAKFLPDWIRVNINSSITFLQRQLSIIEEILKIHHQCNDLCLTCLKSFPEFRSTEDLRRLREIYPSQPNMQARWLDNSLDNC